MGISLDDEIHFDVITSNPSTGAAVDADAAPSFAVFEQDTDTAILSGNFTKRTGLTGNYRASATISTANGFEIGKWYNVVASATVGSVVGKAVVKTFEVVTPPGASGGIAIVGSSMNLASTGLDSISTTAPSGVASNFREMLVQLWRRSFKKSTLTSSELKTYADNGSTVLTTQTVSDDGTTQTQGAAT